MAQTENADIELQRLGQQQKEILRYLYENRREVRQQVNIIESLYGGVTETRQASVSRSISKLRKAGLVQRQNSLYHPKLEAWCAARPRFGITDAGEEFVETDDRFPEIEPDTDADAVDDREGSQQVTNPSADSEATDRLTTAFPLADTQAVHLISAGFETPADVRAAAVDDLTDAELIGEEAALRMKAVLLVSDLLKDNQSENAALDMTTEELAAAANVDEKHVPELLSVYIDGLEK